MPMHYAVSAVRHNAVTEGFPLDEEKKNEKVEGIDSVQSVFPN
jgi:hypothetical protein